MPQRPSSPTPLLWAHKLGLEHQHVLGKIKVIESADHQRETRMAETEAINRKTQETVAGWNDLAVRVQLLEEDDSEQKKRFETLDRDRNDRIEKQGSALNVQEAKLRNLEVKYRLLDEVMEKMINDHSALVKAIKKLEETVSNHSAITSKAVVSPDDIKALYSRIKTLEAEEQERVMSKQQLAASRAKSQREAEQRKTLEANNQQLAAENAKLQRVIDQRADERVLQRLREAAELPPPTPGAAQYPPVVARSSPLTKSQRYRSGFNLRTKQLRYDGPSTAATRSPARLAPPQSGMISTALSGSEDLSSKPTPPPLIGRKRKQDQDIAGPGEKKRLKNASIESQAEQSKPAMAEPRDMKAEQEGRLSSHVPSHPGLAGKKEVLRKRNRVGKFTRNINGKQLPAKKQVLQGKDATTTISNPAPAPKSGQLTEAAPAQQRQIRPKRDLAMNPPVTLEELEAEFGF